MTPAIALVLLAQAFGGIGLAFGSDSLSNRFMVTYVGAGLPAHVSGVYPGDVLVSADRVSFAGMGQEAIVAALRGEVGSSVTVAVERDGLTREFEIQRTIFDADSVRFIGFGCFSGDCERGHGIGIHPDRERYEGEFKMRRPHGLGTYYQPSGTVFTGRFEDGLPVTGSMRSSNGTTFEGEVRGFRPNGVGTFTWPNGYVIAGEWLDGRAIRGTVTYPSGNSFTGDLDEEHRRHGSGVLTLVSGGTIEGKWVADRITSGTYSRRNGDRYEGGMNDSFQEDGRGTYTFASGRSLTGDWVGGTLLHGTVGFAGGGSYTGPLVDDAPFGDGVLRAGDFEFGGRFDEQGWVGLPPTDALMDVLGRPYDPDITSLLKVPLGDARCYPGSCNYDAVGVYLTWKDGVFNEVQFSTTAFEILKAYPGALPHGIPASGHRDRVESVLGAPREVLSYSAGDRLVYRLGRHRAVISVHDDMGVVSVSVAPTGFGSELASVARTHRGGAIPSSSTTAAPVPAYTPPAPPRAYQEPAPNNQAEPMGQAWCTDTLINDLVAEGWTYVSRSEVSVYRAGDWSGLVRRTPGREFMVYVVGGTEKGTMWLGIDGTADNRHLSGSAQSSPEFREFGCSIAIKRDTARGPFNGGGMTVTIRAREATGFVPATMLVFER